MSKRELRIIVYTFLTIGLSIFGIWYYYATRPENPYHYKTWSEKAKEQRKKMSAPPIQEFERKMQQKVEDAKSGGKDFTPHKPHKSTHKKQD